MRSLAREGQCVLIDCLTLWLAGLLFPVAGTEVHEPPHAAFRDFDAALAESNGKVIVVSNEIGLGVVPMGSVTRLYVDELGRLNQRVAVDDDLRAAVAGRFEQDRIEVDARVDARGDRLQRLRAANLAAVHGDRAVERHVLRLERRDPHAAAPRKTAQARDQRAFAGVGGGALDHQGAARREGPGRHGRHGKGLF